MKGKLLVLGILLSLKIFAQTDSTVVIKDSEIKKENKSKATDEQPMKLFYSQRIINVNTVEVLNKGIMEFRVTHNFDDIAGKDGGIRKFFGLDAATDIKIGFQIGLSDRTNILLARTKGNSPVSQQWEFGYKHQFMHQTRDNKHPFSVTVFANVVASSNKATKRPDSESNFDNFENRLSEVAQILIAKKIGSITLQISPSYLHRHRVIVGDDFTLWSIGGGARIPLSRTLVLIADYWHTFRSPESKYAYKHLASPISFYDPFSLGLEILTHGHVFHLNFTNAKEILENRVLGRTTTRWEKGQFRWSFSISRNFVVFRDKNK